MISHWKIIALLALIASACAPYPQVVERYAGEQQKTVLMLKKAKPQPLAVERIEYHPNGNLASRTQMRGQVREGKHRAWDPAGALQVTGAYQSNRRHKKWVWYSPAGQLDSIRSFKGGTLDGLWQNFLQGWLVEEKHYRLGRLEGPFVAYDPTGQKRARGRYGSDLPSGRWTWWRENGSRERVVSFHQGRKSGPVRIWDQEGQLMLSGAFDQDRRVGQWKWYHGVRALDSLVTYAANRPHGVCRIWYSNGEMAFEGQFQDGQPDGEWRWYSKDGRLDSLKNYRNGVLNGPLKVFYTNGQLARSQYYLNASLDGTQETYYPSGQPAEQWTYEQGVRSGSYGIWRESGIMEEEGRYVDDQPHGLVRRWYSTGLPSSQGVYQGGRLHGVLRVYSPSNVLVKEKYFITDALQTSFEYHGNGRLKVIRSYQAGEPWLERRWNRLGMETSDPATLLGTRTETEFYPSGIKRYECTYRGAVKHGVEWSFYGDRSLQSLALYHQGIPVLVRVWPQGSETSRDEVYRQGELVFQLTLE